MTPSEFPTIPTKPPRQLAGNVVTLYHGAGIARAFDGAKQLLLDARPDVVQLHTFMSGLDAAERIATSVRRMLPGTRIWVGLGVDAYARRFFRGIPGYTREKLVQLCVTGAERVAAMGAECLVWNAEEGWKSHPSRINSRLNNEVAREVVIRAAAACPKLVFAHTAYDHPSYHSAYPWKGWIGPHGPVQIALPQVYAAPGGDAVMAHRGALPKREARALSSWAYAVKAGWIEPDIEPDVPDDLDWRPYVQLHSVPCADTVALAVRHDLVCFWAAPTRMDADGRRALLAVCGLARLGYRGPRAVHEFQAAYGGLKVDGVCGPRTLAALGIED